MSVTGPKDTRLPTTPQVDATTFRQGEPRIVTPAKGSRGATGKDADDTIATQFVRRCGPCLPSPWASTTWCTSDTTTSSSSSSSTQTDR